jgi:hypothetical protein
MLTAAIDGGILTERMGCHKVKESAIFLGWKGLTKLPAGSKMTLSVRLELSFCRNPYPTSQQGDQYKRTSIQ